MRKSVQGLTKLDKYSVLKYPLTTESAMKKIEEIHRDVQIACLSVDPGLDYGSFHAPGSRKIVWVPLILILFKLMAPMAFLSLPQMPGQP